MTLPIAAFIGRYLLHVPAPGTRVVRSYGLYAPTKHEALAVCRAQLGQGPVVPPWCWTGRRRARTAATTIPNAVRCVVASSCASA